MQEEEEWQRVVRLRDGLLPLVRPQELEAEAQQDLRHPRREYVEQGLVVD